MQFYNAANVIIYINGVVDNNGNLDADFYSNYTSSDPVLAIVSAVGSFTGTFTDNASGGNYSLTLLNGDTFRGRWQGVKDEM